MTLASMNITLIIDLYHNTIPLLVLSTSSYIVHSTIFHGFHQGAAKVPSRQALRRAALAGWPLPAGHLGLRRLRRSACRQRWASGRTGSRQDSAAPAPIRPLWTGNWGSVATRVWIWAFGSVRGSKTSAVRVEKINKSDEFLPKQKHWPSIRWALVIIHDYSHRVKFFLKKLPNLYHYNENNLIEKIIKIKPKYLNLSYPPMSFTNLN